MRAFRYSMGGIRPPLTDRPIEVRRPCRAGPESAIGTTTALAIGAQRLVHGALTATHLRMTFCPSWVSAACAGAPISATFESPPIVATDYRLSHLDGYLDGNTLEIYAAGHKQRPYQEFTFNFWRQSSIVYENRGWVWKRVRRLAMLPVYQPRP